MITEQSIQHLLSVIPIDEVVGDYVSLRKSGSRYKAPCPFHNEKTPSFVVSPTLGIYKCFGCQKGGNAIQFLMDIDNLSFSESAKILANRYGITLEETRTFEDQDNYKEKQLHRESIQAAVDFAADYFQQQLHETEEGTSIALPYFRERGFTQETIKKWQLGYNPENWESLTNAALQKGYKSEFLLEAGLIKQRDNGSFYDLFRHRVIFPIHSVVGKVIGFGGRKMGNADNAPKYVNSPETELYKKSEVLFGVFQAKNSIKKKDKVLLCEGYTDVITLHQYGVDNAVASSGTALTPGQIKLVKRFTENVTVIYDGDTAGIKASLRGIDLLLEEDLNVRVVLLPDGEDPDSYCQQLGGEEFAKYVDQNEKTFIVFKAELLLKETNGDPLKKSDAVKEILKSVSLIKDGLKRSTLVQQLASVCQMEEVILAAELGKLLRKEKLKESQQLLNNVTQSTQELVVETKIQEPLTDKAQELGFFRLMLLHGNKPAFEATSLFHFLKQKIQADDFLEFHEPFAQELAPYFFDAEEIPDANYFLNHPNEEIARWAAGELTASHELSEAFAANLIDVSTEETQYLEVAINLLLHFKRKKIDKLIKTKLLELKNPDCDMEELLLYVEFLNEQKREIASVLGMAVSNMWIN
ncbi:MAG: DNA primase [Flavobacterium stagni]